MAHVAPILRHWSCHPIVAPSHCIDVASMRSTRVLTAAKTAGSRTSPPPAFLTMTSPNLVSAP